MYEVNKIKLSNNCYWDPHNELVYISNSPVKLSDEMRRCLVLLIYHRDTPLKDQEIFSYVCKSPDKPFNNKFVRSLVSKLRKKLPCIDIINHYGGFYLLKKYREPTPNFQEYLFDFLDQAKNGITVTDPNQEDNPIVYVNHSFSSMFGYSPEDVIGKNCRFLQAEDRNQPEVLKIRKAIEDHKEIEAIVRNYHKSGELIYNEIQISPIFDKKTLQLKYFLGVQKNVTDIYNLTCELKNKK